MNRLASPCGPIMLTLLVLSCNDLGTPDSDWAPIPDCIMGVAVDYQSHLVVRNQLEAERAFSAFITFSRINNQDIAGYSNTWRFDSASKHGLYEGVKYWAVSASWFSVQDNQWHKKNIFDVSEHGNVVRLLGCI